MTVTILIPRIEPWPAAYREVRLGAVNVRVLIDGPSELVFDYAVPAGLDVRPGCRVRIPLRRKSATGTVLSIVEPEQMDFALREVESLIDPEPLITPVLLRTGEWIADYYGCGIETVIRSLLPESVRSEENSAKTRRIAFSMPRRIRRCWKNWPSARRASMRSSRCWPTRRRCGWRWRIWATARPRRSRPWRRPGLLRLETEEVRRDPEADGVDEVLESQPLALNPDQQRALDAILASLRTPAPKPILLLGVTGSGKTEVYLQAARHVLDLGKTVLVLVPEISLTPQTVRRFKSRFAAMQDQVAVLHSNLSQGERFDEWHRIRKGVARIVIGARSAVFAPLPDLGLILVDEEHENTYKQENVPRYHGRDVAVLRAAFEPCAIVLGSATPSLESWHNARTGKYEVLRLDQRADGQSMPLVRIVDMRLEAAKHKGAPAILSDKLRVALEQRLAKGEQSILFLNRRGFARSLQCPQCGHVCQCPHCAVALTYHRTDERLVCHVCGHQAVVPRKCPECKDPAIILQGYGTQKVEEVMAKVLPQGENRPHRCGRHAPQTRAARHAQRLQVPQDRCADRHADDRQGAAFPQRHAGRHPQCGPQPACPGFPGRRAHVPAHHPGRRPRRPRRSRRRGDRADIHAAFAVHPVCAEA